ncbi:coiled-coil domain-containing protein 130-like [Argonauta hians]
MAERKAVNRYYPPGWDPSKGSINKYVGSHPLRERARKLNQGILVIRFELPYNIWCGGCNSHVGMGVRYNAEKKKTGNYYSTPIYTFRMKCHLCDNYFEIQTDPKNHDYVILSGARRKEQRWDPKENEQIVPEDKDTQKKLVKDAMYKLEHGTDDKQKLVSGLPSLAELEEKQEVYKDDFILNSLARSKFREHKKSEQASLEADQKIQKRISLSIPLVKEHKDDIRLATLIHYHAEKDPGIGQKDKRHLMTASLPSCDRLSSHLLTPTHDKKLDMAKRCIAETLLKSKKSVFDDSPVVSPKTKTKTKSPSSSLLSSSTSTYSPSSFSEKCKILGVKPPKQTEQNPNGPSSEFCSSSPETTKLGLLSPANTVSSSLGFLQAYSDSSDEQSDTEGG